MKPKISKTKRSAQELIGIQEVSGNHVLTRQNTEMLFYRLRPVNVAVLPASVMEAKEAALANVLAAVPSVELVCLNTSESFEDNKTYFLERIQQEDNPAVQRLCEQDIQYLDDIQRDMATAREFYVVLRQQAGGEQNDAQRLGKVLKEQALRPKPLRRMISADCWLYTTRSSRLNRLTISTAKVGDGCLRKKDCLLQCSRFPAHGAMSKEGFIRL